MTKHNQSEPGEEPVESLPAMRPLLKSIKRRSHGGRTTDSGSAVASTVRIRQTGSRQSARSAKEHPEGSRISAHARRQPRCRGGLGDARVRVRPV